MREAFRLVYYEAIKVQAERERLLNETPREQRHSIAARMDSLLQQRDGLINAMVAIAQAATGMDQRYLASYDTFDKAWSFVFANAGDFRFARVNT